MDPELRILLDEKFLLDNAMALPTTTPCYCGLATAISVQKVETIQRGSCVDVYETCVRGHQQLRVRKELA